MNRHGDTGGSAACALAQQAGVVEQFAAVAGAVDVVVGLDVEEGAGQVVDGALVSGEVIVNVEVAAAGEGDSPGVRQRALHELVSVTDQVQHAVGRHCQRSQYCAGAPVQNATGADLVTAAQIATAPVYGR